MPSPDRDNLFTDLPAPGAQEAFQTLLGKPGLKIERIVSHGHVSPADGSWYDQHEEEWVVLLQGSATLQFEDGHEQSLQPGDYLLIPARCRHRVSWTQPDADTVWLAVHYSVS